MPFPLNEVSLREAFLPDTQPNHSRAVFPPATNLLRFGLPLRGRRGDTRSRLFIKRSRRPHCGIPIYTKSSHWSTKDCYARLVAAFSEAVLAGRDPNPSGADGLRNVLITDAIVRSAREGKVATVESRA